MRAQTIAALCVLAGAAAGCAAESSGGAEGDIAQIQEELGYGWVGENYAWSPFNGGSNNLHLQRELRFPSVKPGASVANGRALFGLAADDDTIDNSNALFQGPSMAFGGVVQSNGRSCSSCHRGASESFGMPQTPLTDTISLTDPLFTGIDADAGGDPDAMENLNQRALFKIRPNRFNLARPASDPYRRVFFWRKSPAIVNMVFTPGFLNDGRGRNSFEVSRGAVFSHTQDSDGRFDDLFTVQNSQDMDAWMFQQISDPALAPLLDKNDPAHAAVAHSPFSTVNLTTWKQWKGKQVFVRDCLSCHNTPNVFTNRWNVQASGTDPERSPDVPPFGPNTSRNFNVGVAERNLHNLRFTEHTANGFQALVLQLVNEDGTVNNHTVTSDIGLAATTGRSADIGKFKVPQLRNIKNLGPYFHDNSAATLKDVIKYFNSNDYNYSEDGKRHPIHETKKERKWLLAFLKAL